MCLVGGAFFIHCSFFTWFTFFISIRFFTALLNIFSSVSDFFQTRTSDHDAAKAEYKSDPQLSRNEHAK